MNVSRRSFLKSTSAGLVAVSSIGGSLAKEAHAETTQVNYGIEKSVPFQCRMCAQFCPMEGSVRDGRLVRIRANQKTPYPSICARGRAAVAALYNPDRIKYPLIRTGERGSNEWRQASWEEALDLVATKMIELRQAGLAHTMAYFPRFNTAPGIDDHIIKQYGCNNFFGYADSCFASTTDISLGAVLGGGPIPKQGNASIMGDYENAKLAVIMGRNPAGGLVAFPWGGMFGRGRKNGMKTIIVDPRKPVGLGETDAEWIPLTPGTDLSMLNGLMNEIIVNKYYDEDYLKKYTNSDMLIDPETMQPVSLVDPFSKESDYLVYDLSLNRAVMKSESSNPALYGEYVVGGKTVKTGFQMMADSLKDFDYAEMSKLTGVSKEAVAKLAKQLNDHKPQAFIERGYRTTRYFNSLKEKQILSTINVMLGNFGVEGGFIYSRSVKLASPIKSDTSKETTVQGHYLKNVKGFELINTKHTRRLFARAVQDGIPYKMTIAFINGQNPAGGSCGADEMIEALKEMDFIVSISPFWNESIVFGDVILPDCTFMERTEPFGTSYKADFPVIAANNQAVEPLFNSKTGYWIMDELAKRIFPADEYNTLLGNYKANGEVDYIRKHQIATLKGITPDEISTITKDSLEADGVWYGKRSDRTPKAKNSPSGKLEIYSTFMAKMHKQLSDEGRAEDAVYFSPLPIWAETRWRKVKPELGSDEFIPITGFHPLSSFTGSQTRNNPVLTFVGNQLDYDAVFVNNAKGAALGLKTGDMVEIVNIEKPDLVSIAKVVLSETVEPNSLFSFYGVGAGYINNHSTNLRYATPIGFNPNHVGHLDFPPLFASSASHDFIVKIRPAQIP